MRVELLFYTSVFALMVGMSGSLFGVEPDEDVLSLPRAAVSTSSDPLSTEDWRAPFFQKNSLSEASLDLTKLKNALAGACLKKDIEKKEQLTGLLIEASQKEDRDDFHELLYQLYAQKIPLLATALNDPQKATEILERAYAQEEMWSFWAKARLEPENQLTKAHYLAANRGHEEAIKYVNANTLYKKQEAEEFCKQLKKEKKQKLQDQRITAFEETWKKEGYAQPFLDVLSHIKTPILDRTRFLKIAADLGDLKSQVSIVNAESPLDDKGRTFPYLVKAAKQGHLGCINRLGELLAYSNPAEAEKWFRKAAARGHRDAMFNLGELLDNSDPTEAEKWYREAANLGDMAAIYNVGMRLYNQNKLEEAEIWFRKTVIHGQKESMNRLGMLKYQQSKLEEAEAWYREAIALGDVNAMNNLGILLEDQNKLEEAEIWYRKAAILEDVEAMYNLALLLEKQNKLEEAETWFRKAIKHGRVEAINNLGALLQDQNKLEKAEACYRKAAILEDVEAMYNLALLLEKQNKLEEAETWYRKAADLGYMYAMNNLGVLQEKQNKLEEAETCYREAIKHGRVEAMNNLGVLLQDQNKLEEAETWYRKAALKGIVQSMIQLGRLDLDRGDSANAIFWFEKAAALGNQYAQKLLEISQKSVQPLALSNDEVLSPSPEAPVAVNIPEDLEIDSELDAVFEKIENPEAQVISSVQVSEQKSPLSEAPEGDETSSSSEDEVDEDSMPASEITLVPDIASDVHPQVINNPKSRREKARMLGLELKKITEEAQKPNRQLSKPSQGIANDILSGDTDHITQADLKALFKDPYFAGQVIVEPTKSGFTVLSHHREKKLHLNAGAHRKHGQEKYTVRIHPNTLKGIKEILNVFDVENK